MPDPVLFDEPMVNGPVPARNPAHGNVAVAPTQECGARPRMTLVIADMNPEQS